MSIRLHIERLVLDGFGLQQAEGRVVKAALQNELRQLLVDNGLRNEFLQSGAVPEVQAATLQVGMNSSPRQLGTQIARSVYGGIGKAK